MKVNYLYFGNCKNKYNFLIGLTKNEYKKVLTEELNGKIKEEDSKKETRPISFSVVKTNIPFQIILNPKNKKWENAKIIINKEKHKLLKKMMEKKEDLLLEKVDFLLELYII